MRIFYWCPSSKTPIGGVKQIFRHVQALRANGFEAYVLMDKTDRPLWFANWAPIAEPIKGGRTFSWRSDSSLTGMAKLNSNFTHFRVTTEDSSTLQRRFDADDYLILPEYLGIENQAPSFPIHLGIFNQNAHYTFNFSRTQNLLANPIGIYGVAEFCICVSQHSRDYLTYTFPKLRTYCSANGVDTNLFAPASAKTKSLAFMSRKLPRDSMQVIAILSARSALAGWSVVEIDGVPEKQVASILSTTAIFLSTCSEEGFGLPPLEAAASACFVVGYSGYAAADFMRPNLCSVIAQGDVLEMARGVEQVLTLGNQNFQDLVENGRKHMAYVRSNFSLADEERNILNAWNQVLSQRQS